MSVEVEAGCRLLAKGLECVRWETYRSVKQQGIYYTYTLPLR
jgi:hypothetical protein